MAAASKPSSPGSGIVTSAPTTAATKPATRITLPTDTEVTMTRLFQAPRTLVFEAWTTPALLHRWYGPPGWVMIQCEIDLRVGGAWKIVGRAPHSGVVLTLHGVYKQIDRPETLVNTQRIDGCGGQGDAEVLCIMRLTEDHGQTTMTCTTRYPTRDVRDSALKHGTTEAGMDEVFNRLAAVLAGT